MVEENRSRKLLFEQLLKVPHRDYSTVVPSFLEALEADPDFTSKAMVYLYNTSAIRDQVDASVITLLQSSAELGLREAGRALFGLDFYKTGNTNGFKALPPYRLLRLWHYIRNSSIKTRRQMATVMTDWLDFIEPKQERCDTIMLMNRAEMHQLYVWLHRKPPKRYQVWLGLERKYREVGTLPVDSIFEAVHQVGLISDPIEKVRLVMERKIPYTIALSLLPKKNPAAMLGLIDRMSPTEAANSIGWVENSGILEMPEVKKAFLAKVALAKDVTSLKHRVSSKAKTAEVAAVVEEARNVATAQAKKITLPTLLLIDISDSMHLAVEVAKEFAAFLGSRMVSQDNLYMVAFNDAARVIKPKSLSLSDVEHEMRLLRPSGATSIGVGLYKATQMGFEPQQVVIITDGGENRTPRYADVAAQLDVQTIVVGLGNYDTRFHTELERREQNVTFFPYTASGRNDYYLFEQIAAVLSGQGKKSLIETIMDIELPFIVR